ncbi:MAG: family 78 glycoside hydrolase catalytic domain [Armatimonadota bacterium]
MTVQQYDPLLCQSTERNTWRGKWIWTENVAADRNVYALFRRSFTLASPGSLQLHITADSQYALYIDGRMHTRGPARAPLDYYLYDTVDVPLDAGSHCLAVLVHHVGESNACMMLGRPGLLVDAVVQNAEIQVDLSSGSDWRCQHATAWRKELPCLLSHFGFWEDCTLAQLPAGWTLADFADDAWMAPVTIGTPPCAPWSRLLARDILMPGYTEIPLQQLVANGSLEESDPAAEIPSVQVAARRRTLSLDACALPFSTTLTSATSGRYVTLDFGRTVSGFLKLAMACAQPGTRLDISYDEILTPEMSVNPERSYAHLTDRFYLPDGPSVWQTVHPRGFRYVTLDLSGAGQVEITRVAAVEETYPFVRQPSFTMPDEELMTFVAKAAETVRICTTDAFTDCPTRERVQWMEDLYMHSRVAAYTFGDTRMLRHALFQSAQGALPDGRINGFFPSERTNCAFSSSSLVWLHLLIDYWLHAGDEDIHLLLPTAARLLAFLDSLTDESGLIADWPAGQFWDWAPIEGSGCLLLTNAAYAWALARLAEQSVFSPLGDDLHSRTARVRQAAHRRCWDAERQLYRDTPLDDERSPIYSQQANTLAVLAGVCPPEERPALLRRIIDPALLGPVPIGEDSLKEEHRPSPDRLVPMGTLWFAHFLCQALFEAGLDKEALAQMRTLWGAYADLPTYPETRIQRGNTGHCHGWAGGPAYLLPAYVLGVQPVDAGWGSVRIAPHPGDLLEAHGIFKTPRGQLTVAWARSGEALDLQVDAPDGMRIIDLTR